MYFKEIPGYPGYEASDCGQIRNTKTGKLLEQSVGDRGYLRVKMKMADGQWRSERVHRAVVKGRLRAGECPINLQYELLGHEEKTVAAG